MKKVGIGIVILIALVLLIGFIITQTRNPQEEIKIGAVMPLTGPNAQWGIPPYRGIQLAIEEINSKGGINGKKLKLEIEDSKCEPKEGVLAINKLISTNHKIVIGGVCSSVTLAMAPIAERNSVLLISPASSNPKITESGDYIFRIMPSDSHRGKVFAEYIYNSLNIDSIGVLYINNDGGKGNRDSFVERYEELGGKIIQNETYEQESNDMRSQLQKIKSSTAKALLVVSYLGDTPLVLKQIKELGIQIPLYFQTEAIEDSNVLLVSGSTAEGVVYILPAPSKGKKAEEFRNNYFNRHDKEQELYAAEGYDIVYLITKAFHNTDDNNISNIKNYLYTIQNFQGASGIISFDQNGDVQKPMAIKTIKNGKPELIKVIKSGNR